MMKHDTKYILSDKANNEHNLLTKGDREGVRKKVEIIRKKIILKIN